MTNPQKTQLLSIFAQHYGPGKSELNFCSDYQLLIAVMLSAQTTDKKVNEISPVLFSKYSSFKALSKAKLSEIERIIRPINYYKTKSRHLLAAAKLVCCEHGEQLPTNYQALILLPGVGNKTANVVLSELGACPTLPVDTHVFRVSHR